MLDFIVFNPVFSVIGFLFVSFFAGAAMIAGIVKLFIRIWKFVTVLSFIFVIAVVLATLVV